MVKFKLGPMFGMTFYHNCTVIKLSCLLYYFWQFMFRIYMFRIRTVHVYLWCNSGTDLLSPIRRILGSLQMSIFLTASRSTLQRGQRHLLLPVNLSSFRNNLRHSCKQMTQIMSYQWTILYIFVIEIFLLFFFWRGGGCKWDYQHKLI